MEQNVEQIPLYEELNVLKEKKDNKGKLMNKKISYEIDISRE